MKKIIYTVLSILMLTACKKETTQANSTSNTNSNTNTCIDNPNINFSSIGTPVGKFGDCIKDIDGNSYKTVIIGTQTWMAENLKTSKYNDGSIIPNIKDFNQWGELTTGAWRNNLDNDSIGKIYGKLYNWYVTNSITNGNKNVCPAGWHIPSDVEWSILINYIGEDTITGIKMREVGTKKWLNSKITASNTSLFTGIPSGACNGKSFEPIGYGSYWWSSSEYSQSQSWGRSLEQDKKNIFRYYDPKHYGESIRCIKD